MTQKDDPRLRSICCEDHLPCPEDSLPPFRPSYAEKICNIKAARTQYNFINSSVYRNVYLPIILYAKYNNDTQSYTVIFWKIPVFG